jgi:hypothetical protein
MQIYYALFDQATDVGNGNYWTWVNGELSHELLTRFYNEFAVKHLAPEPNKLGKNVFWGGVVHLAAEELETCGWVVLYREFDGGYDRQNRPNRFVILTAWIRTNELFEGIEPIFTNEVFDYIANHSKELPVPPPKISSSSSELKMRSVFKKFMPYVNPYWDSHLQIENKPSGLDMLESDAFVQELDERFKEERQEKKRIKEELNEKLHIAEELMQTKEVVWEAEKEKLSTELKVQKVVISNHEAEIKSLRRRTTESRWQLLAGGALAGTAVLLLIVAALFCTGNIKFDGMMANFGSDVKTFFSKKIKNIKIPNTDIQNAE